MIRLNCVEIQKIEDDENEWNSFNVIFVLSEFILIRAKIYQNANGKCLDLLTQLEFWKDDFPNSCTNDFRLSCFMALEDVVSKEWFKYEEYNIDFIELISTPICTYPFDFWEGLEIEQLEFIIREKKRQQER